MKQRQKGHRQKDSQRLTRAVTHIRLGEANPGKLAALDELAPLYLALCQQYETEKSGVERPNCAGAWKRRGPRSFLLPAARAGNGSSGTYARRSTGQSMIALLSILGYNLPTNSFRQQR